MARNKMSKTGCELSQGFVLRMSMRSKPRLTLFCFLSKISTLGISQQGTNYILRWQVHISNFKDEEKIQMQMQRLFCYPSVKSQNVLESPECQRERKTQEEAWQK